MKCINAGGVRRCAEVSCVIIAFMAAVAHGDGASVKFISPGGDLASVYETDWEGGVMPSSPDDTVRIAESGIFTASSDISVTGIVIDADSVVVDLSSATSGKITLSSSSDSGALVTNGKFMNLNGGTWDFSGTGDFYPTGGSADSTCFSVSNGCKLLNIDNFYVANGTRSDREVRVEDNAEIYAAIFSGINGSGSTATAGKSNELKILSGGKVYVSNRSYSEKSLAEGSANGFSMLVSGSGSLFKQTGSNPFYFGFRSCSNCISVADGGAFEVPNANVKFGHGVSSAGNVLEVGAGGAASLKIFSFGSSRNALVVSNGSFSASESLNIASGVNVTGNVVRVSGEDAVFSFGGNDFFGTGFGNTVVFDEGFTWKPQREMRFMYTSSNNVFRVKGGSAIDTSETLLIGYTDTATCTGNEFILEDRSQVKACRFCVTGRGNKAVIDDSSVEVSEEVGFRIGYRLSGTAVDQPATTNNVLVMRGAAPAIRVTYPLAPFHLYNGSLMRFELPASGYTPGHVLITAGQFGFHASSRIEVECSEFLETLRSSGKLKAEFVLYSQENSLSNAFGDWIRVQNASMPEGCRLAVSGGELTLECRIERGFVLSVR